MLTETKRVENHDRVVELLNSVERDGISDLLKWLEESDFFTAPASRAYHGAYIGGLCEHSLNVYDEAKRLLSAYPEVEVSDETVIISALLHDLCKVNFYATEKRNRKNSETGQWESYDAFTIKEKFCYGGHGSKSVFLAQNFIKLTPTEAIAIKTSLRFHGLSLDHREIHHRLSDLVLHIAQDISFATISRLHRLIQMLTHTVVSRKQLRNQKIKQSQRKSLLSLMEL